VGLGTRGAAVRRDTILIAGVGVSRSLTLKLYTTAPSGYFEVRERDRLAIYRLPS
jgi:hypothetical protein